MTTIDAATSGDATQDAHDAAPACASTGSQADLHEALVSTQSGRRVWIVRARDEETFVTLVIREREGENLAPSEGVFGEEQLLPSSAQVSMLVQTDCHAHGDHDHCGPSYVPGSGTWRIVRLGNTAGSEFAVTLNASLRAVRNTSGGYAPIEDDVSSLCVENLALEGLMAAP